MTYDQISCVYEIRNKENGFRYIGSTTNFKIRIKSHKYHLKKGIHNNMFLQHDYNKYGASAFEFNILEKTEASNLKKLEQEYIYKDLLRLYNIKSVIDPDNEEEKRSCLIDRDLWEFMKLSDPNLQVDQ